MKSIKLIHWLLILVLLKGIVWSLLIPLWHFPDEQAHFGHVANNVEPEHSRATRKADLTEEIAISEKYLGTFRDHQGNNRFTYHPEYNLEYSNTFTGFHENTIKSLPLKTRFNKLIQESAYYPELFYNLSGLVYKLFYQANIFIRAFTIRMFWLPLLAVVTYSAFKTSQLIFKPQSKLPLVIAITVACQPMLTFVSSGITSDNLFNALFSLLILFSALIIRKFSIKNLLILAIITGLGLITKPQFLISFLITIPAIIISLIKSKISLKKLIIYSIPAIVIVFIFGGFHQFNLFIRSRQLGRILPYFGSKANVLLPDYSLLDHFVWTIKHTIREVVPWYWGVFRWLSLALPRWINRVFNRLMIVAAVGVLIKLIQIIKNKQFNQRTLLLGFITYIALVYFMALFVWDWNFFRNHNFSFGIQGRYYFPVIIPHLILLVLGLHSLIKLVYKKASQLILWLISLWMILANWLALYHLTSSYYSFVSINSFLTQASQYKPFFAKNIYLIIFISIYLLTTLWFLYKISKHLLIHEKK